jgi:uncharacterized membrane protein
MSDVPPPPPPTGGAPSPYGGDAHSIDVGVALSYGWKKFTENAAQFVLIALVLFGGLILGAIVFVILIRALGGFGLIVGELGFIALTFVFAVGIYQAGLEVTAGRPLVVSEVFKTPHFANFVVCQILVALSIFIGTILCIIPGIIAAVVFAFAPFYVLDQGQSATEAMRSSYEIVRANLSAVIVVLIVAYIVWAIGAIVCLVGALVAGPVALVMLTYTYRRLNGQPVAA